MNQRKEVRTNERENECRMNVGAKRRENESKKVGSNE